MVDLADLKIQLLKKSKSELVDKIILLQGQAGDLRATEDKPAKQLISDSTDRIHAREALYQSEEIIREAVKIARLGHFIWDEIENRMSYCSEEVARIYNTTVEEYIDWTTNTNELNLHIHPEDRQRVDAAYLEARTNLTFLDIEYRISLRGDTVRHVHELGTPVLDDDGHLIRSIGTVQDITETRQAEEALRLLNEQLSDLNNQKDKFFSIIAHDLKGPFNTLLGYSNLLSDGAANFDRKKIEDISRTMSVSAERAFMLLQNLLEWAHMQMGQLDFEPRPFDLQKIIETNLDLFAQTALEKRVNLQAESNDPLTVFGDARMADTIVRNLVNNAIKFTPENGEVTVNVRSKGDWAEVEVSDTGVGIPADKVEHLFQLGEKTSSIGTQGETGTGLGLYLCMELAEKQGGKIEVDSTGGEGATFRLTLPLANNQTE